MSVRQHKVSTIDSVDGNIKAESQPEDKPDFPATISELLEDYVFKPVKPNINEKHIKISAKCYDEPNSSGKLALYAAQTSGLFNLTQADPFLRAEFLECCSAYPNVAEELKSIIESQGYETINEEAKLAQVWTQGKWSSTDPSTAANLHERLGEANRIFKLINEVAEGKCIESNLFGYATASIGFTGWCTPKRSDWDVNTPNIPETMIPALDFSNPALFKRAGKKRLLDKTGNKQYQETSERLNYGYNVGSCCGVFVAWNGWYLMNCSDQSVMPLDRARRIACIEMVGITNWASLEQMFCLPALRPFAQDIVRTMGETGWRSDPACVAGLWSGIYQDMKRFDAKSGKWPSSGFRDEWAYTAVQLAENVATASNVVLYESGCDPDLLFKINIIWRKFDDLVDPTTDANTGEVNNQLYNLLTHHFKKETSRVELAELCIEYHNGLLDLIEECITISDASKGHVAKMMSRACAYFFMWFSRYNIWHKFLLGLKSGVISKSQKPTIRWEMVDADYMAKVYEHAGCSCASGKYAEFVKAARDHHQSNRRENAEFKKCYTSLLAAILGITACTNAACDCAAQLAEYMDAEHGGEMCSFIIDTLHFSEKQKIRYHDIILELVDSKEYSVYRYVAAGVGYYFKELAEVETGSLIEHCSQKWNSI